MKPSYLDIVCDLLVVRLVTNVDAHTYSVKDVTALTLSLLSSEQFYKRLIVFGKVQYCLYQK